MPSPEWEQKRARDAKKKTHLGSSRAVSPACPAALPPLRLEVARSPAHLASPPHAAPVPRNSSIREDFHLEKGRGGAGGAPPAVASRRPDSQGCSSCPGPSSGVGAPSYHAPHAAPCSGARRHSTSCGSRTGGGDRRACARGARQHCSGGSRGLPAQEISLRGSDRDRKGCQRDHRSLQESLILPWAVW